MSNHWIGRPRGDGLLEADPFDVTDRPTLNLEDQAGMFDAPRKPHNRHTCRTCAERSAERIGAA